MDLTYNLGTEAWNLLVNEQSCDTPPSAIREMPLCFESLKFLICLVGGGSLRVFLKAVDTPNIIRGLKQGAIRVGDLWMTHFDMVSCV